MTDRTRYGGALLVLTLLAATVFLTGIGWGLPSHSVDPYLFGTKRPWTGAEILSFAGERSNNPDRGADVAMHPITDRKQTIVLNETDQQRAEIIRRYRLYSYQPDEMLALMALATMNPRAGNVDPKFYYYGGLFIYPLGAGLKLASIAGVLDLRSNLTYYLDHPEAFGRFYVVDRFIVAMWGIVGLWVVFALVYRLTQRLDLAALTGVGYVFLPVVVNMSHEGKPHLPGAVLMLLTVLLAHQHVADRRRRWAYLAGIAAGAATGMVVCAIVVFSVLPVMALLAFHSRRERIRLTAITSGMGVMVYFVTNPYVAINLIVNRQVLRSNFGNAGSVYHVHGPFSGLANAVTLLIEGVSPALAIAGAVIAAISIFLSFSRRRECQHPVQAHSSKSLVWLLAIPTLLQLIQFISLASGKSPDYGRFAIFADVVFLILALGWFATTKRFRIMASGGALLLIAGIAFFGGRYWIGFIRDCRPVTSRLIAAEKIRSELDKGASSIAIWAEPAPYSLPPVDLFKGRLVLVPPDSHYSLNEWPADLLIPRADAVEFPIPVSPHEQAAATIPPRSLAVPAISWADRSFCIFHSIMPRAELNDAHDGFRHAGTTQPFHP